MAEDVLDWRRMLLAKINAPTSERNVSALGAWAASEGMPIFTNNPLALTRAMPGSTPYPKAPIVQIYISPQQGVDAYTLELNTAKYAAIRDALRAGASYQTIWEAINASPWCGGCQGGKYPVGLWSIVFGNVSPPPPAAEKTPVHEWVIPAEKPPAYVKELHHSWTQAMRGFGHVIPNAVTRARKYVNRYMDAVD